MAEKLPCELISWGRIASLCHYLATKVRQDLFHPQIIVAIGRGGYVPARLLADYLDLMALTSIKVEHYVGAQKQKQALVKYPLKVDISNQRVLLVDDVSDTGDTFEVAISHLQQCSKAQQIKTAVLHHKTSSRYIPDFYGAKVTKWRWLIYPWAQVEDIRGFIGDMTQKMTQKDIATRLYKDYGIKIPDKLLHYILQTTHII